MTTAICLGKLEMGVAATPKESVANRSPVKSPRFGELLEKVASELKGGDVLGLQIQEQLNQTRTQLLGGIALEPRQLLLYQIRAGELNIRVELVSKAADALLSTLKKLQNQP